MQVDLIAKKTASLDTIKEFANIILNDRKKLLDFLLEHGSYDELKNILEVVNQGKDFNSLIKPSNKFIWRSLESNYENASYPCSTIDWLPTLELVDSVIRLAEYFSIGNIEEINCGMGLFVGMIRKKYNDVKIKITASDLLQTEKKCDLLNFHPIARRDVSDFVYYEKLQHSQPEMIIVYYDREMASIASNIKKLLDLIRSGKQKVILIITPNYYFDLYESFEYIETVLKTHNIESYYAKAFNVMFHISELFKKQHLSGMVIHTVIRKDIFIQTNQEEIKKIISEGIFSDAHVNSHCMTERTFAYCYGYLSDKLIKNMYQKSDMMVPFGTDQTIISVLDNITQLKLKSILVIPEYIYTVPEFIFWSKCILEHSVYLQQNGKSENENRIKFLSVYITITTFIEKHEYQPDDPQWFINETMNTPKDKFSKVPIIYYYMKQNDDLKHTSWNRNLLQMISIFKKINASAIKYFTGEAD